MKHEPTLARGRLLEAASFTAADPGDWPGLDDADDLRKLCPMCAGTGLYAADQDCPKCGGKGLVW